MLAAGKAGQLEVAFELQEDMRAEGIKPCQVRRGSLCKLPAMLRTLCTCSQSWPGKISFSPCQNVIRTECS